MEVFVSFGGDVDSMFVWLNDARDFVMMLLMVGIFLLK